MNLSSVNNEGPKCVLLLYQKIWGWLYEALIPHMRNEFGTRFIILAPASAVLHLNTNVCGPEDEVIDLAALEKSEEPADTSAAMKEGARNEERYNVSYLRDLVQQLRTISANYLTHSPMSNYSVSHIESWPRIVNRLNLMFDYFGNLLSERGVDLVICRPDIAFSTLACVHVAAARGIPVTFGKGVRYKDYLGWACGPYAESDYLAETFKTIPECEPTPREELVPPGGSGLRWSQARRRYSFFNTAREVLVQTIIHTLFLFKDIREGYRPGTRRLSYSGAVRQLLHARKVGNWIDSHGETDIEAIASQPYVLFLLPQEPEFSIQSLCREFPHTFTVAQQLALCLPPGTRLVIKEHSLLTGRRLSFYQDLLRLPNVVLAHRLVSGIDLADRSAAVATMSGTTGVEATLLGKQVVLIGRHIEYGFLPNIQRVRSFDNLPEIMREALRERTDAEIEAVRRAGSTYRATVAAISYSAPGTPPLNGDRQTITDAEVGDAIKALLGNYRFQKWQATQQKVATQ